MPIYIAHSKRHMIIGSTPVVGKMDMLDMFSKFPAKNFMVIPAEICVTKIKMQL